MSRLSSIPVVALALVLGSAGLACAPKIGDDCSSSTDCSVNGDRLCDTTQPGGYCTVFNCEPDTCPDEAQCVAFDQQLDPACVDPQTWARFERTFCMRRCDDDGDCRSGYICYDMSSQPNPWGAVIVDIDPEGRKICISPTSGAPEPEGLTEVCQPYDGGFPDAAMSTPDADMSEAGESGAPDASDDAPGDDAAETGTADASDDASVNEAGDDAPADTSEGNDAGEDASTSDAAADGELDGGASDAADDG